MTIEIIRFESMAFGDLTVSDLSAGDVFDHEVDFKGVDGSERKVPSPAYVAGSRTAEHWMCRRLWNPILEHDLSMLPKDTRVIRWNKVEIALGMAEATKGAKP